MQGLLIADQDRDSMKEMASIFNNAGYDVTMTNSVATALNRIIKKVAQVAIISNDFDEMTARDLIPLLKRCNSDLNIILVANEMPLHSIRELRKEGIFYHALKPARSEDREELRQVVRCAFNNGMHH